VTRQTFSVATLGRGAFARGLSGRFELFDFPSSGARIGLLWQEAQQGFAIVPAETADPDAFAGPLGAIGGIANSERAELENPTGGSYQSGIGLISGWACEASKVEIAFDGGVPFEAAYGNPREDTRGICGDANNGFGALFNWNLLGTGSHTLVLLVDGSEIERASFTVTTLGLGPAFVRGLVGSYTLPGFPGLGQSTRVAWLESLQNFALDPD
jgi:hypothetical protein